MSENKIVTQEMQLADGRTISVETGRLARQSDGAVVVQMGNTMLLATVVARQEPKEGADFLPLMVDYQEKFASAGRIPGGFIKREGRLSDHEILVSRLVDRALRPTFPDDFHADVQVNINLISADTNDLPDSLAAYAASAAIMVSDLPFNGPISEVRVGKVNGEFVSNPTVSQLEASAVDIMVAGSMDSIVMVEGELAEVSEEEMLEAVHFAHEEIKKQCLAQIELSQQVGSTEKREYHHESHDEELRKQIFEKYYDQVYQVVAQSINDKHKRSEAIHKPFDDWLESLPEDTEVDKDLAKTYFKEVEKKASRDLVLKEHKRLDGRKTDEIRPIDCLVDYLPATHGSALFTRGETQSLTTVTLGTKVDEQMIDAATQTSYQKFILHYNFPGYSTGEVKPNRGPARREVGHGNLAYRALKRVIPSPENNPYTIRVVSDILESNGSSSMATVCAGCLALMDSGIQISRPVSGIAMGLITDPETGQNVVLSDILGDEDFLGDMDFKVAGTTKGITAVQMDIKVKGLDFKTLETALHQAKAGRAHILDKMLEAIPEPRAEMKPHAPRSETMRIDRDLIGTLIGPGGKIVQEIQRETETVITIDEDQKGGIVTVFATDGNKMDDAVQRIKAIVALPEVNETYVGTVNTITPFGAFIEFMPGKEGLLHISEVAHERIQDVKEYMDIGDQVKIKLTEVDPKTGKYRLSRKALLPDPQKT